MPSNRGAQQRESRSTCPRPLLTTLNLTSRQGERDATHIAEKNCALTQLLVISQLCDTRYYSSLY